MASATSDKPILTFVAPCKGRLEHLRASLPAMLAQPDCAVVVVDSSCPDGAARWVAAAHPEARVVSLDDGGKFNLSRCRNAGARAADTEWICFIDADVVVSESFSRDVIPRLAAGSYYLFANFPGRSDLTGTCVVRRQDAQSIDGYDEVFEAWGGRDRDFYMRLDIAGRAAVTLPNAMIKEIFKHSDDLRTTFYTRKDMLLSQSVSALYRLAKFNLLTHGGVKFLTPADRKHLYAKAEAAVAQAMAAGARKGRLLINLPTGALFRPGLGDVTQTLAIEIDISRARR